MSIEQYFKLCLTHDWNFRYAGRNVYYRELEKSKEIIRHSKDSITHTKIYEAWRNYRYPNAQPELKDFIEKAA
jgi:hypothetical protein